MHNDSPLGWPSTSHTRDGERVSTLVGDAPCWGQVPRDGRGGGREEEKNKSSGMNRHWSRNGFKESV